MKAPAFWRARLSCAPIWLLAARTMLLLAAYSLMRGLFLVFNWRQLADASSGQLLFAMVQGLRFDVSTILLLNTPFILLDLALPISRLRDHKWFRWAYATSFALINFIPLAIEAIDIEGFQFFGRRSSLSSLAMLNDIEDQALQLVIQFWYIALIAGFLFLGLGLVFRWASRRAESFRMSSWTLPLSAWPVLAFGVLAVTTLGIRGGLQAKPLSPAHAFTNQSTVLGALTLNTTFNTIHNKPGSDVRLVNYLPPDRDLHGILGGDPGLGKRFPPSKDNVVILILEGFGLEHVGEHLGGPTVTPFFSSLASKGLYFNRSYANGRRSMEALSSILAGIPSLMEEPYISSSYSGNEIHGLAEILRSRGYATHFFHGAKDGSMFIDSMARLVGFEHYHGMAEYPDKVRDFDGDWGIADEPFLQYSANQISSMREPFAVGIFTLSAHNPYTIPKQHQGRFSRGTNPIHEVLAYSDYALQRFFESASKQPWYHNTLFVLTADHTASSRDKRFRTETGLYRVPLVFFHPGGKLPVSQSHRITQHTDIPPSVLDFLGIEPSQLPFRPLPFGHSVFDEAFPGRAVNQASGKAWMVTGDRVAWMEGDHGRVTIDGLDPDGMRVYACETPPDRAARLRDELHAYMQIYKNGLIRNDWYR